jgi:hypothetical protein
VVKGNFPEYDANAFSFHSTNGEAFVNILVYSSQGNLGRTPAVGIIKTRIFRVCIRKERKVVPLLD